MNVAATPRYAKKRLAVIAAASQVLNRKGVRGMTLADVAAAVGFNTTSVTYYFRKKEDLAAACILDAVERFDALIAQAAAETLPDDRLRRLIDLHLRRLHAIDEGAEPPLASFNEIRALGPPHAAPVMTAFNGMFRRLRDLLETGANSPRRLMNARANLVLEQLLWMVAWIGRYDTEDRPRIVARMFDILHGGLAPPGAAWRPHPLDIVEPADTFLRAATRLINQQGYRGASVEKISASLNVTKGSFYHHIEAKDDLIVACFERTYTVMRSAQRAALSQSRSQYDALSSASAALVAYQVSDGGPLLRSSALSVVPEPIRQQMLAEAGRISGRFAAMISDGVAEGSIRPVDPFIASQMILGAINAVADLPLLAPTVTADEAVALYARPMLTGLL